MFKGYEPWDEKLFHGYSSSVHIPVSDDVSWQMSDKRARQMYDKMNICEWQPEFGTVVPHGVPVAPSLFPLVSKPIINLFGMSMGAAVVHEWDDELSYMPGHFLSDKLKGRQISIDGLWDCESRKIVWTAAMVCNKRFKFGSFSSFVGAKITQHESHRLEQFCERYLSHLTTNTAFNVEMIGGVIIEGHLRFSPQFVTLYPVDFLSSVVSLYEGNCAPAYNLQPFEWWDRPTSYVLNKRFPGRVEWDENKVAELESVYGCKITFCGDNGSIFNSNINPSGTTRMGYINAGRESTALLIAKELQDSGLDFSF